MATSKSPLKLFLLLALISYFAHKACALEDSRNHHFHTLQFTSLLPDSTCKPFTGSIKRTSTLEVTHIHGPCSKVTQDNPATLSEVLTYDQSRVNSINSRLTPNKANTNKIRERKANLPVQSGRSLGSGNYLVTIGLGTPQKTLSLIFDTGSDLTWTQCQPCARSCYQQKDPVFDPKRSSSYSNISCTSSECSGLSSATGNNPGCSATTCIYGIQYGDQSFSVGFFSQDKLALTRTDVFQNFLFGCGQNNQGLFGSTAGLLGLGRDPLSIISQTATKYGKYFSYCLPSTSSLTGHLTLGKSANSVNVKFTPFAASPSKASSFYFIDIIGISVGGHQLAISATVFKTASTIIDSGTVISRLPPAAYNAMSAAFKQQMKMYPTAPAFSILDTCFEFKDASASITIPMISFTFGENLEVNLDATGILIAVSSTRACLAFAGNGDASDVAIFGNTQQKTLEVVYDVGGGNLGFGIGGCK